MRTQLDSSNLSSLSSLLSSGGDGTAEGLQMLNPSRVKPDADQPRREFSDAELAELAESIKRVGILQPIVVREATDGEYVILFGERRWRAAQLLKMKEVPCVVRDDLDTAAARSAAQIIENMHRTALSHEEMARWVQSRLTDGLTQKEVAAELARPVSVINDYVAWSQMPKEVAQVVAQGRCGDLSAVAELCREHRRDPEELAKWLKAPEQAQEITRSAVRGWRKEKKGEAVAELPSSTKNPGKSSAKTAASTTVAATGPTIQVEAAGRKGVLELKAGKDAAFALVRWKDTGKVGRIAAKRLKILSIRP